MFVLPFWLKDLSGNFLSRCVEADLWELWVGGEPMKTAGPILRGRTLQEGRKCVLRVSNEPGASLVHETCASTILCKIITVLTRYRPFFGINIKL